MSLDRWLEPLRAFLLQEESKACHKVRVFLMGQELSVFAPTQKPTRVLLDRYAPYISQRANIPFGSSKEFKAVFTGNFPEELSHLPLKPSSNKEASYQIGPYRLIKKLRSGMRTLVNLKERRLWVEEPSLVDWNSMVNIINDFLSLGWLDSGFLLMHAGAVATKEGDVVIVASNSGRGKTTMIFRLLGCGFRYVSNDRVLLGPARSRFGVVGFPKLPRVNPGTMVADPNLRNLLNPKEKKDLASIGPEKLWSLDSKRDIQLEDVYGTDVINPWGWLRMIVFLGWSRGTTEPLKLVSVSPERAGTVFPKTLKRPVVMAGNDFCANPSVHNDFFRQLSREVGAFQAEGTFDPEKLTEWIVSNISP